MARYKPYDYDQALLLPVCLQDQLIPGTLEFAIHTLVESRMDACVFDSQFNNDDTGRLAYDPKVLLKVVLVAYSRGIISSRKIEQACRENTIFMALACGQVPDHSTVAAFISSMKEQIQPLFRDVLLVCEEMNLLGGTTFALDGCKLPSNASREWSGTFANLARKRDKLAEKVRRLVQEQVETDEREARQYNEHNLSGEKRRDEQIRRLHQKADRIDRWLGENEPKLGQGGREIQSNVTDNESAKMVTSHGTIQGYNGQTLVDAKRQVIVQAEAFGNGQDFSHVSPLVEGAKENLRALGHCDSYFEGKSLAADSNYHSQENLAKCCEDKIDAYVPDVNFRKRDPRFVTQGRHKPERPERFTVEDFRYDEASDRYLCPNGKVLRLYARKAWIRDTYFRRYEAEERDCAMCPVRGKCVESKATKRKNLAIALAEQPITLHRAMMKKIDTEQGRRAYGRRLAIVEPIFANLRIHKRLDRFTLRGKIKVNIQWLLYCMVHNIEKIANYGYA